MGLTLLISTNKIAKYAKEKAEFLLAIACWSPLTPCLEFFRVYSLGLGRQAAPPAYCQGGK